MKHPDLEKNAKDKELKIARIRPSDSEIEFIQVFPPFTLPFKHCSNKY